MRGSGGGGSPLPYRCLKGAGRPLLGRLFCLFRLRGGRGQGERDKEKGRCWDGWRGRGRTGKKSGARPSRGFDVFWGGVSLARPRVLFFVCVSSRFVRGGGGKLRPTDGTLTPRISSRASKHSIRRIIFVGLVKGVGGLRGGWLDEFCVVQYTIYNPGILDLKRARWGSRGAQIEQPP